MLKAKLAAAALGLCAAFSAHAITQVCDDPESPFCGGGTTTTPPPAPVGPLIFFGTFNKRPSILVVDTTSKLCDLNLANCRPAYGVDALKRGREFSVGQLLRWDRSGAFAVNATEIIACFAYFDSPGSAYFSCQWMARNGMEGYVLDQSATALGWRAYTGAGLVPQSADKINALYAQRQRVTAYTVTYGTFPPDKKRALETEDTSAPAPSADPAPPAAVEMEIVTVTGSKERPPVTSVPPATTIVPSVLWTPVTTNPYRSPEIILNPCVSFSACADPPPPPSPYVPPPICTKQCTETLAVMKNTCEETSKELGLAASVGAVGAGVVTGFMSRSPTVGYGIFKWSGTIGAGTTAAWLGACVGLNTWYNSWCTEKAKQNGC
jgi:hypothetical protein